LPFQISKSMLQIINQVGQQSLAMSLQIGAATTEHAGREMGNRFKTAMPGAMRDYQINNSKSNNPVLQHPSAEPMLKMLKSHFQRTQPGMSSEEITSAAEQYLVDFGGALSTHQSAQELANSPQAQASRGVVTEDFEAWGRT
jgi:hypothetical protein